MTKCGAEYPRTERLVAGDYQLIKQIVPVLRVSQIIYEVFDALNSPQTSVGVCCKNDPGSLSNGFALPR
jgi:hypothetical protein